MSTFGRPNAFGTNTGTTGFGMNQQTQGTGLFGSSTTGFGAATTSNNLFGQQPIFGNATTQPQQSSVFGTSTAAPSTGFGTGTSLFSGTNTMNSTMNNTQSLFGGNKFGSSSSNLFSTATTSPLGGFSSVTSNVTGTTIKFNPLLSTDTMVKNGSNQNINTRHQCITCMKEYENKSLEELRYEDYQANRKGTTATSMFGTTQNQTATNTNLFGTTPSTGVSFNTTNSLFNAAKPAFGAATTTATTSIFNTTFNKSFTNTNSSFPAKPSFFTSTTTQPNS